MAISCYYYEEIIIRLGMKLSKKRIKIIVEITKTGYSAYAKDLPVYTTGRTVSELQRNLLEALNFYFEEKGISISGDNLLYEYDLKQFFQYYKVLNAKHLAEKIGMNPTLLSQYVQGKKKPSEQQSERIIIGIQKIGKELAGLRLISK